MTTKTSYSNFIEQIRNRYVAQRDDMLKRHSKVLQVRFDLHYPHEKQVELPDGHLSKFTNRLSQDIKRNYKMPDKERIRSSGKKRSGHAPDPRIILVREQHDNSDNQHIHGLVLLNGNATQRSWDVHKRVERNWANALGDGYKQGLVHYCDQRAPSSIMMNRSAPDFEEQVANAQRQAEYLDKVRGKEKRRKGTWKATGTRVPKSDEGGI